MKFASEADPLTTWPEKTFRCEKDRCTAGLQFWPKKEICCYLYAAKQQLNLNL